MGQNRFVVAAAALVVALHLVSRPAAAGFVPVGLRATIIRRYQRNHSCSSPVPLKLSMRLDDSGLGGLGRKSPHPPASPPPIAEYYSRREKELKLTIAELADRVNELQRSNEALQVEAKGRNNDSDSKRISRIGPILFQNLMGNENQRLEVEREQLTADVQEIERKLERVESDNAALKKRA
jgi:hypothetical protein